MATRGLPVWPWTGAPADDLPRAERLLLDATRLWRRAARRGEPALAAARLPCIAEDAEAAAAPLDQLLRIAAPPDIGCPLCPRVTPGEAALLLDCALAQRGARSEALAGLLRRVGLREAYCAMPPAILLGVALGRSGLLLRHALRDARR